MKLRKFWAIGGGGGCMPGTPTKAPPMVIPASSLSYFWIKPDAVLSDLVVVFFDMTYRVEVALLMALCRRLIYEKHWRKSNSICMKDLFTFYQTALRYKAIMELLYYLFTLRYFTVRLPRADTTPLSRCVHLHTSLSCLLLSLHTPPRM